MRKVLAHSTALFKEGVDGRSHFGRFGVEAEILMDARGEIEDRFEEWPLREK